MTKRQLSAARRLTKAQQSPELTEYLRRNIVHCKAVGAAAAVESALKRLGEQRRAPTWLLRELADARARLAAVTAETSTHRDELKSASDALSGALARAQRAGVPLEIKRR